MSSPVLIRSFKSSKGIRNPYISCMVREGGKTSHFDHSIVLYKSAVLEPPISSSLSSSLLKCSEWMDMLHCVLLLRLPATNVKSFVLWLQCLCALPGLMVASRDACPLCDKPFYRKQKFLRSGTCDIRVHCMCLQLEDAELATVAATGERTYKCNACAKKLDSSSNDKTRPNHRNLCHLIMKELWAALHLMKMPLH
jgi:endogenous inhibitor of DNA gyrase (YacG/DUF329 family)